MRSAMLILKMISVWDSDLPTSHCFKLEKSLYRRRSSPRSWIRLDRFIKSLHFTPCIFEPCQYHAFYKGECVYLTIYVDDIFMACANLIYLNDIKKTFVRKLL